MDQHEIENWTKIAVDMEARGTTDNWFYKRARSIADGRPDPMPRLSRPGQDGFNDQAEAA